LHHAADVPTLFRELARIARPGGRYILEFANKKNLKAIARYWAGRQAWSPFTPEPVEFAALNFDFQPGWIRQQLTAVGFSPGRTLTVSHYRFAPLKKIVPTGLLVKLDSLAQLTGNWWQLSPSVFLQVEHPASGETATSTGDSKSPLSAGVPPTFFACPTCKTPLAEPVDGRFTCPNPACHQQWRVENGLYDFKEPV